MTDYVASGLPGSKATFKFHYNHWIGLFNAVVDMKDKAVVAEAKKKKLVSRAYIPLTPEMLAGS